MARAWGCTPAQLRDCTLGELEQMVTLLVQQAEDAERARRG